MTKETSHNKRCTPSEINSMYIALSKARISQTRLAEKLGISRTTLHLMFKHEIPMRRVYKYAIKAVLDEKREHENRETKIDRRASEQTASGWS